ncbi:MAG: family 4 glycosyl hydrolase [Anaerolineae bacterium]
MAANKPKIVLIGAGSASFGIGTVRDIVQSPELVGGTLVLVDINRQSVRDIASLARMMVEATGCGITVTATADRTEALPDADFVVVSIERDRERLWGLDFQVPLQHGMKQVTGENGGPGGLFHSLRNIPPLLDIARDVERLCPQALLINFTNPMSRICLALARHTSVNFIGLCHGVHNHRYRLAQIMDHPAEDMVPFAAGINHFTWILELRSKATGEDLYPLLRRRLANYDPTFLPLNRYLFERVGFFPSPKCDHPGEYLAWAWQFTGLKGPDLTGGERYRNELWQRIGRILAGTETLGNLATMRSGERAVDIMCAMAGGKGGYEWAVNIPNRGHIENLPDGAIVEVPATVTASGIHGVHVGALPEGAAVPLRQQIAVQDLVVEAAVTGSRQVALQAMLADPVVQDARAGETVLEELLRLEADYLPQFA